MGGWGDGEMESVGVWEKLKNVYPTITMQDYPIFFKLDLLHNIMSALYRLCKTKDEYLQEIYLVSSF
ncbi:MAG: hypothetical protein F6K23_13680 [Okeania sp. SIO2C9]|uniref:hypothetical protein n=1 Tax=Okeania sp. SIO2C9 TaxID=2607791 RepID=UPI0013C04B32|nr:hypothetical protein [Okeania sp. SIO2C9]NEQ73999.1 hypothetical protein [Okeania sp. SIO2C9]